MGKFQVIDHPLIQHKLTIIRDKNCGTKVFREVVDEIAMLMAYEVSRDMPLEDIVIETPITLEPHEYFVKLPEDIDARQLFVVDPMLATGGSAIMAIDALKERGASNIKFVCLVAAPEGVKALQEAHPDIDIYTASLDEKLNEHGYIVPGLGDAGDRLFGTK